MIPEASLQYVPDNANTTAPFVSTVGLDTARSPVLFPLVEAVYVLFARQTTRALDRYARHIQHGPAVTIGDVRTVSYLTHVRGSLGNGSRDALML